MNRIYPKGKQGEEKKKKKTDMLKKKKKLQQSLTSKEYLSVEVEK